MKAFVDEAITSLLDNLLTTNRDANEGYTKASNNVSDLELKKNLIQFAQMREKYIGELKLEIESLGGEFKDNSSLIASIHRVWIDIRGTITGKDEVAILNECLRGEEASLFDYEQASINNLMPDSSMKIILRHKEELKRSVEVLKKLIKQQEVVAEELK